MRQPRYISTLVISFAFGLHALTAYGAENPSSKAKNAPAQLPWVRHSGGPGIIIFIHGVFGDDRSTWRNGTAYWPEMLLSDSTFDGQDIYVARYDSSFGKGLSIDQVADNLYIVLANAGIEKYRQITFISHSMGGLVTRSLIIKYRGQLETKTRFAYFYATPTTGSEIARVAARFSKNPQFHGMQPMKTDGYLEIQQSAWINGNIKVKSFCAYETQPTYGVMIVERPSATNLCTERIDAVLADHIAIVKPLSIGDMQHQYLQYAFIKTAPEPVKTPAAKAPARPHDDAADAILNGCNRRALFTKTGFEWPERAAMFKSIGECLQLVQMNRQKLNSQPLPQIAAQLLSTLDAIDHYKLADETDSPVIDDLKIQALRTLQKLALGVGQTFVIPKGLPQNCYFSPEELSAAPNRKERLATGAESCQEIAFRPSNTAGGKTPDLAIVYPAVDHENPVDLTAPVAIHFENIPLQLHPWLIVRGQEGEKRYWPVGACDKDGHSLIEERPRRQTSGDWEGDVRVGSESPNDKGQDFTLVLVAVDKREDDRLAKVFRGGSCRNSDDGAQDGTRIPLALVDPPKPFERVVARKK